MTHTAIIDDNIPPIVRRMRELLADAESLLTTATTLNDELARLRVLSLVDDLSYQMRALIDAVSDFSPGEEFTAEVTATIDRWLDVANRCGFVRVAHITGHVGEGKNKLGDCPPTASELATLPPNCDGCARLRRRKWRREWMCASATGYGESLPDPARCGRPAGGWPAVDASPRPPRLAEYATYVGGCRIARAEHYFIGSSLIGKLAELVQRVGAASSGWDTCNVSLDRLSSFRGTEDDVRWAASVFSDDRDLGTAGELRAMLPLP